MSQSATQVYPEQSKVLSILNAEGEIIHHDLYSATIE